MHKCVNPVHALIVYVCVPPCGVCVAAVPWNLRSVYAPLLQTQWLFVPNITPGECHTWAPLILLIYRFQSQSCRGCPPPLGWGHAQNQKMYGWTDTQGDISPSLHPIELVTHFTFFLHLLQITDHISISVSLMRKNSCLRGRKQIFRANFISIQKTRQSYLLSAWT